MIDHATHIHYVGPETTEARFGQTLDIWYVMTPDLAKSVVVFTEQDAVDWQTAYGGTITFYQYVLTSILSRQEVKRINSNAHLPTLDPVGCLR